ncbi:hypothetical protein GGTG_13552 [Gaeumannomyces tritici R3-111a-1]|uniref:Uncharacterized protein n=1 Tax=Gaeumannomyces tritici (strain R3-111a-1) TaxID=644352 RepID=J3PJ70_GAET3|nr:hypothetical protein GGTG_13552 [Gaeumannomyces tritici R3-111a-1]EJT68888.1 hypothetical protein GGTG_13552 [Gaeumannomyces tritici R3-111a-1]
MDPHFEVAHLPDMRESASRVRFFAGDMTPVEGRGGLWRLPKSHRTLLQSVKDLILLYNRNYPNLNNSQTEELNGNQIEGAITIENLRKNPTILLSKPKMSTGSKALTPGREFQPITLQAGDILQLYENDGIHVTNGGIAAVALRYKTEKTT